MIAHQRLLLSALLKVELKEDEIQQKAEVRNYLILSGTQSLLGNHFPISSVQLWDWGDDGMGH